MSPPGRVQYLADRHDAFVLIAEHLVARAPLQDLEHADETPAEEVAEKLFDCRIRPSIARIDTGGRTAHRNALRRAHTDTTMR